ncbi:MAG: FHA domain-containing protein [Oscillospiraceae bacterium]|nr:FHA domain-containing protein [Oscillospiraceae bacterium]
MSRVHCIIRYDKSKNSFYIMDSSTNGTYGENGQRFATGTVYNIAPNSKFYLATNDFMFMVGLI